MTRVWFHRVGEEQKLSLFLKEAPGPRSPCVDFFNFILPYFDRFRELGVNVRNAEFFRTSFVHLRRTLAPLPTTRNFQFGLVRLGRCHGALYHALFRPTSSHSLFRDAK